MGFRTEHARTIDEGCPAGGDRFGVFSLAWMFQGAAGPQPKVTSWIFFTTDIADDTDGIGLVRTIMLPFRSIRVIRGQVVRGKQRESSRDATK
jgi:hypothetical protein